MAAGVVGMRAADPEFHTSRPGTSRRTSIHANLAIIRGETLGALTPKVQTHTIICEALYILVVIRLSTRCVEIAGVTPNKPSALEFGALILESPQDPTGTRTRGPYL